uniref:Uncharacterized protein n=1 Tax=Tanacetum cinerariifolium TaxID=118510 RepID=A0A6L2MK33_TANCI|nr:hypothetical protein [Tanacetum cinerariifolium]
MPNVDIPQGMDTGGSPRCQETMGGTPAQTRSERVLKQPNEPPLTESHTSSKGERRMEHPFELTDTVPPTPYDSPLTGGEVHEIAEPSKDDDDATLAETLLNIKRSSSKDKRKGIMQKTELPKKIKKKEMIHLSLNEELAQKLYAEELAKEAARQRQLNKREEDVAKGDQTKEIDRNDPTGGYKQSYFKGMKYEDIRPIFERVWDQNHTFVPKDSDIEREVIKRSGFHLQQESSKKQKLDQQTKEEEEEVKVQVNSDQEVK